MPCPPTDEFCLAFPVFDKFLTELQISSFSGGPGRAVRPVFQRAGTEQGQSPPEGSHSLSTTLSAARCGLPPTPPPALPPQSLSFPAWALCRHLSISLMLRWMPEGFCGWSSLPPTSVSGFRLTDHCLCVRPGALVRCGPAPCLILAPSFAEPPISHL